MKYFKVFPSLIFILFFSMILKNYFSKDFISKKKESREGYMTFLNKKIDSITLIKSQKNFKKFLDNSNFFKKNNEEKEFWKLLKTK